MKTQPTRARNRKPAGRLAGWPVGLPLCAFFLLLAASARAQTLPLEIRQDATRYNLGSTNGLPISIIRGNPAGSDGRGPTVAQQQAAGLTTVPATTNQFQSFISFGATAKPGATNLNPAQSYIVNAENLDLPRAKVNNQIVLAMPRATVGAPVLSRSISFLFGQVVPPPGVDEFGVLLSTVNTNLTPNRPVTTPTDYWLPEPYTTANHTNAGYYWSPHAQGVFAVNPGPLRVAWRRSASSTNANPPAEVTTVLVLGIPYIVFTNQYIVSGSPVKDPRRMYWTERSFVDTGKPVVVPSARVGAVTIVYNSAFPVTVSNEVVISGTVPITTSNTLAELRTLWLDETGGQSGGQIRAYNVEGRIFVELLGDERGGGARQHLGFEIVDVSRQPFPNDVTIELGERLTAYPGGVPADDPLLPEPLFQTGQGFTFQYSPPGGPRPLFFATRETINQNDLQVHWLEEGLQGLRWPLRFVRYKLVWPDDVTKYSHYVRPLVATEAEAKATAVTLPTQNAPIIDYQDPLDQPRGKLTETFGYYSWLTSQYPAHRALLRFNAGENIRFERVFSWLDEALRSPNLTLPAFNSRFDADVSGARSFGTAYVGDGFLHLTDALNSQLGAYVVNDLTPGRPVQNFRATFTASLRGGTAQPADGFSFNFGDVANILATGEEGIADGLVVSFDLWDNGVGDLAPAISIKLNGVTRAAVSMAEPNPVADPGNLPAPTDPATGQPMRLTTGDRFVPVEIVLYHGGTMDVSYKGIKVLTGIATGYTPRTGQFALAARTGGANSAHWVDNLFIAVNQNTNAESMILARSVATNLNSWAGNTTFDWPDPFVRPRVVDVTVNVGDRISAPDGETGGGLDTNYLAGYILQSQGTSFQPQAYADPFTAGFETANRGAIIPVNAIPGANRLEVWWFRKNAVNTALGFKNTAWPAVIGRYTLQWPAAPAEIVLASDDGSGPLLSLQARGSIYFQNDRTEPGFNPNEEHALVQGGQAFALRDDLNITTNTNSEYSSHPFVLLAYTEADNRPAIRPFKVLREKPEVGITFDYRKEAGAILQPPMPLPLMEKPLAPNISGQQPKNLNTEIEGYVVASSTRSVAGPFSNHVVTTTARHFIQPYAPVALQNALTPAPPFWMFPTNVEATTLSGLISLVRPLDLSAWGGSQSAQANRWRFATAVPPGLATNTAGLLYDTAAGTNWTITVTEVNSGSQYVEVQFSGNTPDAAKSATTLVLPAAGPGPNGFAGQRLGSEPLATNIVNATLRDFYASFTLQDRKANTWIYRGPHDLNDDPVLVMKYYYKTLPGFFFPSVALAAQPPVGTVTPYLRGRNPDGSFEGEPVFGNRIQPQEGDGQPLGIRYRPVWPANVPVLQMAETLLTPKRGLPAVRGQTSLEVVYQQSQVDGGEEHESAILHDPTREKSFALGEPDNADTLSLLPPSVKVQTFQGKIYFPNLPPHLAERFFFDPNRSAFGELVFKGQFVDAALGDKYVSLNVVGQNDARDLKALCSNEDQHKAKWDDAIDGLATVMEFFIENPAQPGTYIPSAPETVGATALARVRNDDVAVDSYALTAAGPGVGFVTLIAGNGRAFTPEGEPVSVQILKVVQTLYRGEVNIVESSNPLNERLTLQQVVDLAGQVQDYNFEWKIASPVDGLPPVVYQNTPRTLVSDGTWTHLRFPLASDTAASVTAAAASRLTPDVTTTVSPVSRINYSSITSEDGKLKFLATAHRLVPGNQVTLRKANGGEVFGTVHALTTPSDVFVTVDPGQNTTVTNIEIVELNERVLSNRVQSIVFRQFTEAPGNYTQFWLSLDVDDALGAVIYIDGQLAVRVNTGTDDTTTTSAPGGLFPLGRVYRLAPSALAGGTLNPDSSRTHTIAAELSSSAFPAEFIAFNVRLEAFASVDVTAQQWLPLDPTRYVDGVRAILGGSADVRSLADNYLIMRYQAKDSDHASYVSDGSGGNAVWSQWTSPQLAEGWIKRVLKGINPFNQRITDLFNNSVNTDVSIVAQAGGRWEGDVALNLETINNAGLIEIYETVLNRGKLLSIGGGINYGPANDALLLAAGYLNDLYMVLGNEAWADASNPTIGIGTKDNTYGAIATALFSFRGQLPSLLEEELALMRGRDDFLLPGVELRPVYNRMIWNYTRGIDAGEVVYALNYNVLDQNTDGRVDADDSRRLYPQGHGDAYGHYLTALKGYYALLLDNNFDWVPRIEAVTVLGKPVSVDYQDERKFAAAAAALARAGKQTVDLTWRRDYKSGSGNGWSHLSETKANLTTRNVPTARYWGVDHWASRAGQGTYLNWVVGNAILPDRDPDPTHEGSIQQIDRTTVPELKELVSLAGSLQTAMDNAEAGLTPLGLPDSTVPFDLNPLSVANGPFTHFEQIFQRAKDALNNALVAFDDAKDVTRLMRSEEDSLAEFRTQFNEQELAYTNALIELYGTPYPNDIGPGRTYRTGYTGPDTIHYTYIDNAEITFGGLLTPETDYEWTIDTQTFSSGWANGDLISTFGFVKLARTNEVDGLPLSEEYLANTNLYVTYNLSSHGFFQKPKGWTSQRASPGRIQQAISDIVKARNAAYAAFYLADAAKYDLDWAIVSLEHKKASHQKIRNHQTGIVALEEVLASAKLAYDIYVKYSEQTKDQINDITQSIVEGFPQSFIAGLAAGGDLTSPARAALFATAGTVESVTEWSQVIAFSVVRALDFATETTKRFIEFSDIAPEQFNQELRDATSEIRDKVYGANNQMMAVNERLQDLDAARRAYRALRAEGDRLQTERQIFRQRAAAVIQGFRTRDAAFRIFRNEKLERYKSLFDLAAKYAFMAAQAYDYDTGLLHTDQGREFINRIVRSRALGIVQGGQPQFAGSSTGDPGLSSALAEMYADWSVLKGRLGFNNPDAYGTTTSLRTENFRILPGTNGTENWQDILNHARKANLLDDVDVRRYCMQLDPGNGLPVPGLIVEFSTTIADGLNLFGHPLAAWDHAFSPSSFATKIFAVGVAFEGYQGMDDPEANSDAVAAGASPGDPDLAFLDPNAMAATPYIYLIPVGVDSMRSPPLGDVSVVRTWNVQDVTVPLPFNLGGSDFSTRKLWQSADSLSEPLFAVRKHQAFRPISDSTLWDENTIYSTGGELWHNKFTNTRLIGRSVWNSKWKIVIPGKTLLNNPDEGLERFIRSVHDIKVYWHTYSYSGN